jgi:hypothetical protein
MQLAQFPEDQLVIHACKYDRADTTVVADAMTVVLE